jgi:hypothetical protein
MKCSVFPVILCCCLSPACYAQGAASVLFSRVQAQIVDRHGQARAALRGAELALGETVDAAEGRVQLLFRDGAQVSLQAADSSPPRPLNPAPAGAGGAPLTMDLLPQKNVELAPLTVPIPTPAPTVPASAKPDLFTANRPLPLSYCRRS